LAITLQYRGPLKAASTKNKRVKDKHDIRRYFHGQLKELWANPPMDLYRFQVGGEEFSVGKFRFKPLLSKRLTTCELDIKWLTRETPGRLLIDGDLDNRLKTLFDALRLPHNLGELPSGASPIGNEQTFRVLLEDDSQITSFRVRSEPLLLPKFEGEPRGYAELYIEVEVKTHNEI